MVDDLCYERQDNSTANDTTDDDVHSVFRCDEATQQAKRQGRGRSKGKLLAQK